MRVSVIATVYNERQSIVRLLDSLASQSRRPDEVVICDGGSQDGTAEIVRNYAMEHKEVLPELKVVVELGANISRGRNLAIAAASGPIIAVTDAGVRLASSWLANLMQPWENESGQNSAKEVAAVAGFFIPDAEGIFQTAMAATVLPSQEDIDPSKFLPSSRSVAFTKEAWQRAGGYPEWLDYCEDLIFDFRMNALYPAKPSAFEWAPEARVFFRPRGRLTAFWKQYHLYARGDGKADLWRKRHAIRYFTYLAVLPLLLVIGLSGGRMRWLGWIGLLTGCLLYCWRPWQRLGELGAEERRHERAAAVVLVPLIRIVGDIAKMSGYPVGLWWRWRNRQNPEIRWRDRLGAHNANVD